jgi:hypothetical protein
MEEMKGGMGQPDQRLLTAPGMESGVGTNNLSLL